MERSVVLVVDQDESRRRALSHGLAGVYEVVPALHTGEAERYAEVIDVGVVVASLDDPDAATPEAMQEWGSSEGELTLLLLAADPVRESEVPDEALFVCTGELVGEDLVRRVQLILLGQELGLSPDLRAESLVGDLSTKPLPELLAELAADYVSGLLQLRRGDVVLVRGEPVAAESAGRIRGLKAFCRLMRQDEGPFRLMLGEIGIRREIELSFDDLMERARAEARHELPDPRTRVRATGPEPSGLDPLQRETRAAVGKEGMEVGELLDEIPATDGAILRALGDLEDRGLVTMTAPERAVVVVTDSSADLPREVIRTHGIEVVPLTIHYGSRDFLDGVDLSIKDFYELLEGGSHHPSTDPPPEEAFRECYQRFLDGRNVVSVHLSEKMSQTVVHARAAAQQVLEALPSGGHLPRLEVVDTAQVSLPLGMLAVFAARMAERGLGATEIVTRLEAISEGMCSMFVVNTLEYLARGGRIGKARAWLGRLLGIRPILGIEDGEVGPVDQVRGGRAAQDRMLELFAGRLEAGSRVVVGIVHAEAPAWADRLRGLLESTFQVSELFITEIGPVVGTHAGPGTVGACLFRPSTEEAALIAPLGRHSS